MKVTGATGKSVSAYMELEEISQFMAILSQCEHALVLSKAGKELDLPIDPKIAFEPQAGAMLLGAYEVAARMTVGVDDITNTISLLMMSYAGRLTGYRIKPEMAQRLGQGILDSLPLLAPPTAKQ